MRYLYVVLNRYPEIVINSNLQFVSLIGCTNEYQSFAQTTIDLLLSTRTFDYS